MCLCTSYTCNAPYTIRCYVTGKSKLNSSLERTTLETLITPFTFHSVLGNARFGRARHVNCSIYNCEFTSCTKNTYTVRFQGVRLYTKSMGAYIDSVLVLMKIATFTRRPSVIRNKTYVISNRVFGIFNFIWFRPTFEVMYTRVKLYFSKSNDNNSKLHTKL